MFHLGCRVLLEPIATFIGLRQGDAVITVLCLKYLCNTRYAVTNFSQSAGIIDRFQFGFQGDY